MYGKLQFVSLVGPVGRAMLKFLNWSLGFSHWGEGEMLGPSVSFYLSSEGIPLQGLPYQHSSDGRYSDCIQTPLVFQGCSSMSSLR